ncbi:hypothetical protein BCAR13_850029 [Paraburkholderia caribensis]|nr:hypothetical protein BCAR13_850029 [Paraburkholderia caribensis]
MRSRTVRRTGEGGDCWASRRGSIPRRRYSRRKRRRRRSSPANRASATWRSRRSRGRDKPRRNTAEAAAESASEPCGIAVLRSRRPPQAKPQSERLLALECLHFVCLERYGGGRRLHEFRVCPQTGLDLFTVIEQSGSKMLPITIQPAIFPSFDVIGNKISTLCPEEASQGNLPGPAWMSHLAGRWIAIWRVIAGRVPRAPFLQKPEASFIL